MTKWRVICLRMTVIGYWGGFPGKNEATSGYLFEYNGYKLLVDCGSGVVSQLQNYISIESLNAVIISHYHHDHIADIGPLQYGRLVRTMLGECHEPLPIYGHTLDSQNFSKLTYKTYTTGIAYNSNNEVHIGPFTISFLKTNHPVPCFAMKISTDKHTVIYTADSSYLDAFIPFSKEADLLIAECSFYGEQDGTNAGHLNSYDVGNIAKEAKVKEVLLTHLPHFGEHSRLISEAKEKFNGKVSLASSGLVWEK
jgi:ribonuclease BN (tRNA processing enzyme)